MIVRGGVARVGCGVVWRVWRVWVGVGGVGLTGLGGAGPGVGADWRCCGHAGSRRRVEW